MRGAEDSAYLPMGHATQEDEVFRISYLPGGQSEHVEEFCKEKRPDGHAEHFVDPRSGLDQPAGHRTQEDDTFAG